MPISEQNLRISEIEHARIASAALGVLDEPVQEAKDKAISRLISMYRKGETPHDALVGIAAELSALDGLISGLRNTVQRGEVAFAKEHENAAHHQNAR